MSEQRRIDLLFASTVRVLALARAARKAAPVLAIALVVVVAVHGTLGGTDIGAVPRLAMDMPQGWTAPAPSPVASAARAAESARMDLSEPVEAVVAAEPARATPQLDREQQNIARFIAQRYRLTLDATSEFVHHAYRAARDVKIDPMLVLAVMSVESSFNPKAQSPMGAQGLMQVLTRVHVEKFLPFGGIGAAFDPVANIRVGSSILKEYLQREGSVEGALKSYVGAALVASDGGYGLKVLNARERIAAAAAGKPIPPEIVIAPPTATRPDGGSEAAMTPVSATVEARAPGASADGGRPISDTGAQPESRDARVRTATTGMDPVGDGI